MRGTSLPRKVNRLTECCLGYGALVCTCMRIYNKVYIEGQWPMNSHGKGQTSKPSDLQTYTCKCGRSFR
ncbi:hypothetical protein HMPREF1991_02455 [Hoylesella loescheii DSM 19665 = JCM 12249 = ATCC 15930]|uniref:Uncharacterized protein n=1 Tax=Hoylesella loescheii DSM 19665 = JCM 12249 = ATCC 15930 TaxID=1122985 RepID=A0A069QFR3_HOYLO|nr:hypothetical protein HMPREF1991_02455 [Hoylesella loescheii DSM 19665 = JCM 12249 = ATCC 15930]